MAQRTRPRSTAATMLRSALGLLCLTIVLGGSAYHYLEGWSLFDSYYMVVITLSTVGYREVHPLTDTGKLVTIGIIVFGLGALTLIGAGVTRLILEGQLRDAFGRRSMERDIERLNGHYIVCGYGRVGRVVCNELAKAKVDLVVVDSSDAMGTRIAEDGHRAWIGDATEESALVGAGLDRAKGIILALPSEADNVYVTLLVKDLRPDLLIMARAISDHGERRLKAAGADRVVSPNIIGGLRMAHSILHPSVVEFIEIVSGRTGVAELALREMIVPEGSDLAGKTIRDAHVGNRHGVLVVGRLRADESVAFNPSPNDTIDAGTILIVLGRGDDLDRFAAELSGR